VHAGYFAFARQMKAVDPTIKVCASWGTPAFPQVVSDRRFDCLSAHAITSFEAAGDADWADPLEGHDRLMLATAKRRGKVADLLEVLPDRVPLWLTEASTINGDLTDFPAWTTSASHAAHMATLWGDWMELNIPWGMGDDLLWGSDRAVLGPAPHYTYTADAVTREALLPMFEAGGRQLSTAVSANPVRHPGLGDGSYPGLAVTATRGPKGQLFLLVVNRLPFEDVTSRVRLDHFQSAGTAVVRHVASPSFQAWNAPGEPPAVTLETRSRRIEEAGFTATFPSTSTTVIRIPHG
jgi:hypothetical protein